MPCNREVGATRFPAAGAGKPERAMALLTGFFDRFLFSAAVIASVLTAFDWLVGEDGRKRLRERVGDFWTSLQYQSLDVLYITELQRLKAKLVIVYGDTVLSARFILVAFAVNVLWVLLSTIGILAWTELGKELVQISASVPVVTYVFIVLTMLAISLALGWYPIADSFWVIRRLASGANVWRVIYLPLFILLNSMLFFAVALLIFLLAWLVFISSAFGNDNFMQLMSQVQTSGVDPTKNPAMMDFGTKYLFPFVSVFIIMVPISALPFFVSLLLVVILVCLKLSRPLVQPVLSLLLERLYESKQGVLTQIAWILVAVSKAVQWMFSVASP